MYVVADLYSYHHPEVIGRYATATIDDVTNIDPVFCGTGVQLKGTEPRPDIMVM